MRAGLRKQTKLDLAAELVVPELDLTYVALSIEEGSKVYTISNSRVLPARSHL